MSKTIKQTKNKHNLNITSSADRNTNNKCGDKENIHIGNGAIKKTSSSKTPVSNASSKRLPLQVLNVRVADSYKGQKTVRFGNVHILPDSDSIKKEESPPMRYDFVKFERGDSCDVVDDSLLENNNCTLDNAFYSILSDDHKIQPKTPINCVGPDPLQDIKKLRKKCKTRCSYSVAKLEDDLNLIFNTEHKIEHIIKPTQSSVTKSQMLLEAKRRYSLSYAVPGAVYLDPREHYVFHSVLYSTIHLDEVIKNLMRKQYNYRLSDSFLKKYVITEMNRSIVVNWLLKLQTNMKTEHVLVYTAVRLMDMAIDKLVIPLDQLQLIALAAFWISLKFHATDHKNSSWLVSWTGGAYKKEELAKMEREVLRVNNCNVNCIDISVFIHYYILKLEVKNADIVSQCSHYLVDCSLLDSYFVRILPSMLAAGSVMTSLFLLNQYNCKLWEKLRMHRGYYLPEELLSIKWKLIEVLVQVNDPVFPCREPCFKYCSTKYCSVSQIVADALESLNIAS